MRPLLILAASVAALHAVDWQARDKQAHTWAGATFGAVTYDVLGDVVPRWPRWLRFVVATGSAFVIGRAYEFNPKGVYERDDWIATGIGGAGGAAMAWGLEVGVEAWSGGPRGDGAAVSMGWRF